MLAIKGCFKNSAQVEIFEHAMYSRGYCIEDYTLPEDDENFIDCFVYDPTGEIEDSQIEEEFYDLLENDTVNFLGYTNIECDQ
jgi:hypothetical protein